MTNICLFNETISCAVYIALNEIQLAAFRHKSVVITPLGLMWFSSVLGNIRNASLKLATTNSSHPHPFPLSVILVC